METSPTRKRNFFTRPKTIAWMVTVVLLLILILQNVEQVQIDLLFWSLPQVPLLLLILTSMLLGALLALFISWEIRHHRKLRDEEQSRGSGY